jgi:hypothetical protein
MMGACVTFAALCSNMQLLFCCFVCYLEWIYLLASLTDFAEVEVGVCMYGVFCSRVHLRSLFQLVLVVGLVWLYLYMFVCVLCAVVVVCVCVSSGSRWRCC